MHTGRARRIYVWDCLPQGAEVLGNLNAPPAVTASAVIYALRCLLPGDAADVPLNQASSHLFCWPIYFGMVGILEQRRYFWHLLSKYKGVERMVRTRNDAVRVLFFVLFYVLDKIMTVFSLPAGVGVLLMVYVFYFLLFF